MSSDERRVSGLIIAIAAMSLAAIALVWINTGRYGAGLDEPDSFAYVSTARSLAAGEGFAQYNDQDYVSWPPLFPLLLAAPGWMGIDLDPLDVSRGLNAVVLGLTTLTTGLALRRYLASPVWVLLGTTIVALSEPLVRLSSLVRAEPLFNLLTLWFLLTLVAFGQRPSRRTLVFLALWAGLAWLQRYVGFMLVALGGVAILFGVRALSPRQRWQYAAGFGILASLPISIWLVRNLSLTGQLTGSRNRSPSTVWDNLRDTRTILRDWYAWPDRVMAHVPDWLPEIALLVVIAAGIVVIVRWGAGQAARSPAWRRWVSVVLVWVVAYLGVLVALRTVMYFDYVSSRLLSPVYVPLWWLALALADRAALALAQPLGRRRLALALTIVPCLPWLLYAPYRTYGNTQVRADRGLAEYSTAYWQESALFDWIRAELPAGPLYSSDKNATAYFTGRVVTHLPWRSQYADAAAFADELPAGEPIYLVYLVRAHLYPYEHFFSPQDLAEVLELDRLLPGYTALTHIIPLRQTSQREAIMEYRRLGQTGIKISELALGGWTTFGDIVSDKDLAKNIITLAYDNGINFFDMADVYARGRAEELMGAILREFPRHTLVLASKVFWPMSDDINDRGLSRKHLFESIDKSLRRIGTDYLDLYFCHRHDPDTPLEETIRAMDDLIHQGKILYWGTSEWPAEHIQAAVDLCGQYNLYKPVVEQPQYSMLVRQRPADRQI
jgi:hypothetical protein